MKGRRLVKATAVRVTNAERLDGRCVELPIRANVDCRGGSRPLDSPADFLSATQSSDRAAIRLTLRLTKVKFHG